VNNDTFVFKLEYGWPEGGETRGLQHPFSFITTYIIIIGRVEIVRKKIGGLPYDFPQNASII